MEPPAAAGRPGRWPVLLPRRDVRPAQAVARGLTWAAALLLAMALVVWLGRDGYRDSADDGVSLLDALYYATGSLSTTGAGEIAPVTAGARLVNILVVTPLRVLLLIVVIGTTVGALTEQGRHEWRLDRWRRRVRDHTVVVGYGTKGRSAVDTLLGQGLPREAIVVVDPSAESVEDATRVGVVGVVGDATRSEVLRRAEVPKARRVLVATNRDDTSVLVTLTARALNPGAVIASAVREAENAPLLRQSGATTVVTSSDAAGRLLGVACTSPPVGEVMTDLLEQGSGLELVERVLATAEVGASLADVSDIVLAVVRNARVRLYDDPEVQTLRQNDHLVVLRTRPRPAEGEGR